MSVYKQYSIYIAALLLGAACGTANVADCDKGKKAVPCSARTDDENARLALDNGDFATAVTLLDGLVAKEPETYDRFPLCAAAHAGRAGISILALATSSLARGGTGSGSDSGLIGAVGGFLPNLRTLGDAGYDAALVDMGAAVARLTAIPAANRGVTSSQSYAASALLQLGLYQTVYSVMYLNKFVISATTGTFDRAKLETMSDADAALVIDNLAAAAASQAEGNPALQAQITTVLGQVQAQDGSSTKDKLKALIAARNAGGAPTAGSVPQSTTTTPPTGP